MTTLQDKITQGLVTVVDVVKNEPPPVTGDETLVLKQKRFDSETGVEIDPVEVRYHKTTLKKELESLIARVEEVKYLLSLFDDTSDDSGTSFRDSPSVDETS